MGNYFFCAAFIKKYLLVRWVMHNIYKHIDIYEHKNNNILLKSIYLYIEKIGNIRYYKNSK